MKRFVNDWDGRGHYLQMREIAGIIIRDVQHKRHLARVEKVFATLEELLLQYQNGGPGLDLLGAGLIEYLIDEARNGGLVPPDRLDNYMGPIFRQRWLASLTGFFGKGIQSIDQLNRILIPYNVSKMEIAFCRSGNTMRIDGGTRSHIEQRILFEKELDFADVSKDMGFEEPFVKVTMEVWEHRFPMLLVLGNRVFPALPVRYALLENRLFTLDFEAFLVSMMDG